MSKYGHCIGGCGLNLDLEWLTFGADFFPSGADFICWRCARPAHQDSGSQSALQTFRKDLPGNADGTPREDWREGSAWLAWLMHENANIGTPGSHGSSSKSKRYGGPKQGGKIMEREAWGS